MYTCICGISRVTTQKLVRAWTEIWNKTASFSITSALRICKDANLVLTTPGQIRLC